MNKYRYKVEAYKRGIYKPGEHTGEKIYYYTQLIYDAIRLIENSGMKRINNIALDLYAYNSDYRGTASVLLSTGCMVYGYGNEMNNYEEIEQRLKGFTVDDLTLLRFDGNIATCETYPEDVFITSLDPCGFIDEYFIQDCFKHSMITILTVENGIYRTLGKLRKKGKKSMFGKRIPHNNYKGGIKKFYIDAMYDRLCGRLNGILVGHKRTDKQDILCFINTEYYRTILERRRQ